MVALLITCGLRRFDVLGVAFDAIDERGIMRIFRTVVVDDRGDTVLWLDRAKTPTSPRSTAVPAERLMIARGPAMGERDNVEMGRESYRKGPLT
ncbi:hypothetical protein ACWGS9_29280 [Bradyrhizobium sp. Arg314]